MASDKKVEYKINTYARIILLSLAGFLALAFMTEGMGQLGIVVDNSMGLLFGNGRYILPIVMVILGINTFIDAIKKSDLAITIASICLLLVVVCFLDSISKRPGVYINRFYYGMNQNRLGFNGGLIGGFINSFILHLIGPIGLNIVLIAVAGVSLVTIFDLDYVLIGKTTMSFLKNLIKKLSLLTRSTSIRIKEGYTNVSEKRKTNKSVEPKNPLISESNESELLINPSKEVLSSSDIFGDKKVLDDTQKVDDFRSDTEREVADAPVQTRETRVKESEKQEVANQVKEKQDVVKNYQSPPISYLKKNTSHASIDKKEITKKAKAIEETMANFDIKAHVSQVNTGPTITSYELVPEPGVRLSKIVNLSDNLAFSLASSGIRIEAPIPGKSAVGIEVPNDTKSMVTLEEVVNSKEFKDFKGDLPLVLGKDVTGEVVVSDIEKMPHLLIAGATGSGKSVAINSIILSLIYKSSPKDLRLILIDPKIVELSGYNDLPHLLIPVVTDPRKAASTLAWAVEEMERRYKKFSENYVRDIKGYNEKFAGTDETMSKIVIIIDELADLMMVSSTEVEDYISRLAQMARAAGMHLILATQRPSVDVITGTIKANIPSRISFAVSSGVDSRTILDTQGAEKLLGQGDMLFYPSSYSKPKRIQGSFVSQQEVEKIVGFFKGQDYGVDTAEEIMEEIETVKDEMQLREDTDPLFKEAVKLVVYEDQASISYLQRRLRIGYSRAARIVDQMEERNMVGPSNGPKPRDIYITEEDYLKLLGED